MTADEKRVAYCAAVEAAAKYAAQTAQTPSAVARVVAKAAVAALKVLDAEPATAGRSESADPFMATYLDGGTAVNTSPTYGNVVNTQS